MKSPVELNAQGELTTSYKKSKAGKFKLIHQDGVFKTVTNDTVSDEKDYLITVFENGQLIKEYTFDEVRANVVI
ncbi:putative nicotinate phosphoribosyltransferase [compost metagenome]